MAENQVLERLRPIFLEVDRQVRNHVSTDIPFIKSICQYILLSGGKRLRPTLFVLAAHLCGYQGDKEYRYSSIFEYLHAASLLHDDVIDDSDLRRGRTAAHLVYGNQGVILVGDFIMAKALNLAAEIGRFDFFLILTQAAANMAEGEILELLHSRDAEISEEEYERIVYRKTGALMEATCRLGAVLAEAEPARCEALRLFGFQLGVAFQIMDDILDYTTEESVFGKPVGHDLDEGKITLPLIRALAQANRDDKNELLDLILQEQRTPGEFAKIKTLIDKHRGVEQARERAATLVKRAKRALDLFPDSQTKTDLLDLADFIVTRRR